MCRASLVLMFALSACGLSSGGLSGPGAATAGNGGTGLTAALDDNAMVGNGTTWQSKALTDCDSASSAVTYDTSTNAFGCNSIAGGTATYTGSATALNLGNITAGTCTAAQGPYTVTGADLPASTNATAQPRCTVGQAADNVVLNPSFVCHCYVSADNQVSMVCCNHRGTDFDPNFEYYTFYVQNAP